MKLEFKIPISNCKFSDEFTKKVGINNEKIKVINNIKIKKKEKLCLNIRPPNNNKMKKEQIKIVPPKYIKLFLCNPFISIFKVVLKKRGI